MIKLKANESALIFTPDNMHMLFANHIGQLIQSLQSNMESISTAGDDATTAQEAAKDIFKNNSNLYDHLAARMYFEVQMHMNDLSGDSPNIKQQWVDQLSYNDDTSDN